jgi:broad specificity phosphatase PhoE
MELSLAPGLTLYFARHGQTIANRENRFQGWTRDTSLTQLGIDQARAIGRILCGELTDPGLVSFVSSPLPRARRTMEIALEAVARPTDEYLIDDRLAEINLGAWDGLTQEQARALDPGAYDRRESDKWDVRVPGGGENYADVAARAAAWVHDLTSTSFAITHGAFTRILRGLFAGLTWQEMSKLDEPQGCVFRVQASTVERLDLP